MFHKRQSVNRRDFIKTATGTGAALSVACGGSESESASETPTEPASSMYASMNGALFNWKLGWPEFAHLAAKVGYPGTDVSLGSAMKEGLDATKALLTELNLKPAVVGLPMNATRDEKSYKEGLKGLDEAAQFAAAIGCPRMSVVMMPGGMAPKEETWKMMRDRFTAISEILARSNVRLGFEFLGPLQLRKMMPHPFIYRMDEMLEFAKECGPNMGLLLDSWHWYHAEATVDDIIAAGKSRIVSVHVSDCAEMPPEEVKDGERLMPGEGVIDFVSFFQALRKIGYEDGISPEVNGRIPADMPQEEAARLGLETTFSVLRKAGVA